MKNMFKTYTLEGLEEGSTEGVYGEFVRDQIFMINLKIKFTVSFLGTELGIIPLNIKENSRKEELLILLGFKWGE